MIYLFYKQRNLKANMASAPQQWQAFLSGPFLKSFSTYVQDNEYISEVWYTKDMLQAGLDPTMGLHAFLDILPLCHRYFLEDTRTITRMLNLFMHAGADTSNVKAIIFKPIKDFKPLACKCWFEEYIQGFQVTAWLINIYSDWGVIELDSYWQDISPVYWENSYFHYNSPPQDGYALATKQYLKYCMMECRDISGM